jgi:hypothetical protein
MAPMQWHQSGAAAGAAQSLNFDLSFPARLALQDHGSPS